jgi:DNA-binding NarL/FixJ family response regulator
MKTGRVLLADSHLNMLGGVHSLLETVFETVVMVADERSLIEAVASFEPDLVVVDLSLPVAEGANIARQLQGRYPALRIVVLSVYDEPALAGQLLKAGVAGVVLKRTAATDLLPAVKAVLRGDAYVCPALSGQLPGSGGQAPFVAKDPPRVDPRT